MKGKLFSTAKRKIAIITICSSLMIILGATTVFAATQGAKMVKDGKVHEAAIKVKEGLPAGQQFREGEEATVKNIADTSEAPKGPIKTKDSEVPAAAINVKEGLPAGNQIKEGEEATVKNVADTSEASKSPIKIKDSEVPAAAIKVKEGLSAGQQMNK
ncbi:hypothetical protein V6C42_04385 [Pseudoclostridium thermosuccinogenes]|uniref:hypothetical protein n=1 Tax=Clostridium thermosuccinogenes TaxID=84032 RepID=UPI002FDA6097